MKKKLLIIIPIVIVLIIIGCVIFNSVKHKDESKRTIIDDTVTVSGLEIKGPSVSFEGGYTSYSSEVKNTKKDMKLKYVEITLFDSDDKEYVLKAYIGDEIKSNETKTMSYTVDKKLENVKSIKYKIIK